MRLVTFGRIVAVPLSLVVLALPGFNAPAGAVRSILLLVAVGAIGLLALTRWQRLSRVRTAAGMDEVLQTAKDDASDVARMGSDAG